MRAADDFAAIRARMEQLERQRKRAVRDEELEREDRRITQELKDGMKARIIARNRLG